MSIPQQKVASCILTVLLVLPTSFSFSGYAYAISCGTGSNITFTDSGGGQCRGFITTTGASTFTVPTNWTSVNTIEVIGGGGGGSRASTGSNNGTGGGGGGVYQEPTDVVIDGTQGTVFFGNNFVMGDAREVWFIRGGFLYEVTTYKELDTWLAGIMQTWKFILSGVKTSC